METFGAKTPPGPVRPTAEGQPSPRGHRDTNGSAPHGTRRFRRRGERRVAPVRFAVLVPLLAFASHPAALSAESDAAPAPPAARERIPHGTALPLLGRDVKGPSGQVVAQVVNVLVDESGRPLAAVLDYGGFMGVGRRRIAVAWEALRFSPGGAEDGTVTLGLTRDQLKDFPDAKKGEPIVAAAPAPK